VRFRLRESGRGPAVSSGARAVLPGRPEGIAKLLGIEGHPVDERAEALLRDVLKIRHQSQGPRRARTAAQVAQERLVIRPSS
jgi:hypothetical protein